MMRQIAPPSFTELFTPKLVTVLREQYGMAALRADLVAGLTVAIVAIPLSMAIAMFCFSIFIGTVTITAAVFPALMTSVTISFFVFTCLCIIGVGTSWVRGTIHN